MATTNDITGDKLVSKASNDAYRDNWDAIFGKKEVIVEERIPGPDDCKTCGYGIEEHEFGVPTFLCFNPPLKKRA